jgi:hypothetical protein
MQLLNLVVMHTQLSVFNAECPSSVKREEEEEEDKDSNESNKLQRFITEAMRVEVGSRKNCV